MEYFQPIKFSTYIDKDITEVFRSLVTPSGWNGCFTTGATIDLNKKEINFRWIDLGPEKVNAQTKGRDLEFRENEFLSFKWHHETLISPTKVSFDFQKKESGTILTVSDNGYPKTEKGEFMFMDCSAGWAEFLTLLKVYLETGYRYRNY